IHNYFAYRMNETRRRLRFFLRDGRIALVVAIAFLLGCILLRQLARAMGEGLVPQTIDEGLYIVGWVAMWRPLEIFLYDWRPIWRRSRLSASLAQTPVIVRARGGARPCVPAAPSGGRPTNTVRHKSTTRCSQAKPASLDRGPLMGS